MSTQEILAELPRLSAEDRRLVAKALYDLVADEPLPPPSTDQPRRPDLHPGAWEVAGDFDEPLPDGFWLGSDA